jgi:hypothetical protein
VFTVLAKGEELALPNFGLETVHHVNADDVAQLFMCAIASWSASVGEAFHAVSPAAVTLRGYAEAMAAWFGREPKLRYLPWQEWMSGRSEVEAAQSYDHIAHSPNCSIAKAARMLDYRPHYGSIEAVCESVNWLIEKGIVQVDRETDCRAVVTLRATQAVGEPVRGSSRAHSPYDISLLRCARFHADRWAQSRLDASE